MSTQLNAPVNLENIAALSQGRGEPGWLTDLRREAAALAGTLEWPKPEKMRIDRWNLTALGEHRAPQLAGDLKQLPEEIRASLPQDAANLVVQRNSGVCYRNLAEEWKAKGVIFTDLETAAREHGELVRKHLFRTVEAGEDRLTALHAALWNGGVFVYVPKNVELDVPLQAVFYLDDPEAAFAPHILIVADANSRVSYVDRVLASGAGRTAEAVHHSVVEIVAGPGAHVRFASIHHLPEGVVDLSIRRATLGNDARIEWIIGDLNHGNTLSVTKSDLKGNGSSSDSKLITVGTGSQNMSITTHAVHYGIGSESEMESRAVMRDSATAIINGVTKIEKGASKANGHQTERVLMLSPKARGDANPILLIDEDDVKADHAASVGRVNEEQIYYLMSRGIDRELAERLIIRGFLTPTVGEVPIEAVRGELERMIEGKLDA
ncbi:MAG: Fe-S cluster assembly protein SufD [Thermobacillus sp. ZCTH02-B1]|uniref:Fe-S cluster assembly protein SufD n=1 Tax=Thermobacillus sp. ZCTH02-B1 TaxID=1858795 RepID=UPI000B57AEDD|nr:Fe-S cluster assembly protein SufD [Thermobacillus sp. ZCTH02-B1]OUM96166.1 MAG: Fe-S cluster assembly protein SufD [Thermobacillus sp. ZCTH02-B1]